MDGQLRCSASLLHQDRLATIQDSYQVLGVHPACAGNYRNSQLKLGEVLLPCTTARAGENGEADPAIDPFTKKLKMGSS